MLVDFSVLNISETVSGNLTFVKETAGFKNTFGYYKVDDAGQFYDATVIFANASVGGYRGFLVPEHTTVPLEFEANDRIGFFVAPDAFDLSDQDLLQDGSTSFVMRNADGDIATLDDSGPITLLHVAGDGTETTIHTVYDDRVWHSAAEAGNNFALNGDGTDHTIWDLGVEDGRLTLNMRFEDLWLGGDLDYSDIVFRLDLGAQNTLDAVDSGKDPSSALAQSDIVPLDEGETKVVSPLDNDQGNQLAITHVNGQPVTPGSILVLSHGVKVTVLPDGQLRFTDTDDEAPHNQILTYSVIDPDGNTDTSIIALTTPEPFVGETVLTEDVWFQEASFEARGQDGIQSNWRYHGGSEKLRVSVKISLDDLFANKSTYRFSDVDISAYEDVFASLGATDTDITQFKIRNGEIRFKIQASGLSLTQDEIDALPSDVATPIELTDKHGNKLWLDLNVVFGSATTYSPIAFDLNGNGEIDVSGVSTAKDRVDDVTVATALFDIDSDGRLDWIEWLAGTGDALLVDNRDGLASQNMSGARLFGDQGGTYENGYQQLADLDANDDGQLTEDELIGLALWRDDGDAQVEKGEMHDVEAYGVASISVLHTTPPNARGETLLRSTAEFGAEGQLTPPTTVTDLSFASFAARDMSLVEGQALRLKFAVQNDGEDGARAVTSTFYWTPTAEFDEAFAVELGQDGHGYLAAGEIDDNEKAIFDYNKLAVLGDGWIFGVIDAQDAHAETDETNNVSDGIHIEIKGEGLAAADLRIADLRARDAALDFGQKLVMDFSAINDGTLHARAVTSNFYWSADETLDLSTDVLLGRDGHGKLKRGEVDDNERIEIAYDDLEELGDGFIFAVIDPEGAHAEKDESNNTSEAIAITLNEKLAADLQIADARLDSSTLSDGEHTRIRLDVQNTGQTDANATQSNIYWQADADIDIAEAVLLATINHDTLTAGELDRNQKAKLSYEDLAHLGSGYVFAQIVAAQDEQLLSNNTSEGLELILL